MAKELQLTIRPKFAGEAAQKSASKLTKELGAQDTAVKRLTVSATKYTKTAEHGIAGVAKTVDKLGQSMTTMERNGVSAFGRLTGAAGGFVRGIDNLNKKIGNSFEKMATLKNLIIGSAVGGAIYGGAKTAFEEGAQQIKTQKRALRQFGPEQGRKLIDMAAKESRGAGVQDDEYLRGLFRIQESTEGIGVGSKLTNGKRIKTEAEAEAQRAKSLQFGASLLTRTLALNPGEDPEQVAKALSDAAQGPEGIRSFVSQFNLSKHARKIAEANEKGTLLKSLSAGELKKYGITTNRLGSGDLLDKLLTASDQSESAATDERKTLGFAIRSAKAQAHDKLGDLGASMLGGVDGTGKQGLLAQIVSGAPDFIADHLGGIGGVAAGYGGLSLLGKVLNKKGANSKEGMIAEALGIGGKEAIPVYVTNFPGSSSIPRGDSPSTDLLKTGGKVTGTAALTTTGVVAGTAALVTGAIAQTVAHDYLTQNLPMLGSGIKADLAAGRKRSYARTGIASIFGSTGYEDVTDPAEQKREAASYAAKMRGIERDKGSQPINVTLNLDGKVVARVVTDHQKRSIRNEHE